MFAETRQIDGLRGPKVPTLRLKGVLRVVLADARGAVEGIVALGDRSGRIGSGDSKSNAGGCPHHLGVFQKGKLGGMLFFVLGRSRAGAGPEPGRRSHSRPEAGAEAGPEPGERNGVSARAGPEPGRSRARVRAGRSWARAERSERQPGRSRASVRWRTAGATCSAAWPPTLRSSEPAGAGVGAGAGQSGQSGSEWDGSEPVGAAAWTVRSESRRRGASQPEPRSWRNFNCCPYCVCSKP